MAVDRTAKGPSPLANVGFRTLLASATVSYVGTFVQDVGERWLILEITGSALSSALLATAFVTACLLMTLPAGVLADRMDRRRLVIYSQIAQAIVAVTIATFALLHRATSGVLIAGAAAAGVAVALGGPAWSTIVAESVPREQVAEAVTLNAVSFNIARAVGPAIGGLVLAWAGGAGCFYSNAATFVLVIAAVASLRLPKNIETGDAKLLRAFAEPFAQAKRDAGIRSVLISMVVFTFGASFVYVLAPALAKLTLVAGPRSYGLIIGAMGTGAVLGATVLKKLRARYKPARLLATLMVVYGLSAIALSRAPSIPIAMLCCVPAGVGWTGIFSSLSALVQIWTENRLRARAMALYTMVHLALWAVGSSISGVISEAWSIRDAILIGGLACIGAAIVTARLPLPPSFTGATTES